MREQQSGAGGGEREHHALGEKLPDDAHAPCAERRADGDLAAARRAAREQEVRDVAARDQQHDADGREQDEQARAVASDEIGAERFHREAQLGGVARDVVAQTSGDRLELLQRLLARHAALQPAVHGQVVLVVHRLPLRREGDRRPQLLVVRREVERGRHDADDGVIAAVHVDRRADDWPRAEPPHPQLVAEDRDELAAWLILLGRERAAGERPHAEHVEVVRRHLAADDALRRDAVGEIEAGKLLGGNAVERGRAGVRVRVIAGRHARKHPLERFTDDVETIGLVQGKRPQHHGVHRAENCRRAADAERERQNRNCGEAGMLSQLTQCEGDVLRELAKILGSLHVLIPCGAERAKGRAHASDVAEAALGFASRGISVHAAVDELARPHLDMEGELLVHFFSNARTPPYAVEERHGLRREEHARDRGSEARPVGRLRRELLPAARRDAVELRPPAQLGGAPLGLDPCLALETVERGVERSVFDFHDSFGRLLDRPSDAVAVAAAAGKRPEDERIERAV